MLKRYVLLLLPLVAFAQTPQQAPPQTKKQKQHIITPAVGTLDDHPIDYILDVEFLYWYATTTNLAYANEYEATLLNNATNPAAQTIVPRRIHELDWSWNPGVRVGLGLVTNLDGWDVYADWTYLYNSTTDSTSVRSPVVTQDLTNPLNPVGTKILASPWGLLGTRFVLTDIKGRWSLLFNQFDLELGRRFWISKTLILRPYGGLRGGWSRMYFRTKGTFEASDPTSAVRFQSETTRRHQKFWGVGLLAGIETSWFFVSNWGLFGDLSVALVYGPFDIRGRLQQFALNPAGQQVLSISDKFNHNDIYTLQSMYDLAIGFRWEMPANTQSFRARVDLGWESHFLPNFNHLTLNSSGVQNADPFFTTNGDLTLTGFVLRGRFEF